MPLGAGNHSLRMHGVKRVPVAERDPEKEARKLAAAAKVNALSTAMLERKRAGAHDEDSLALSMKVLELNPEFYSAWNFRRQILSTRIRSAAGPEAAVSEALVAELRVLEAAIGKNAKAYCLWTHRLWVIDQLVAQGDTSILATELALCAKFLKMDERNFHCWGYRLAVSSRAGLTPTEQLDFTTEKVNANFSNYSAWHYRARFLSLLLRPRGERGASEDGAGLDGAEDVRAKLREEGELVNGAVFTDPEDQSPWIYLRWIVGQFVPDRIAVVAALCDCRGGANHGTEPGEPELELVVGCSREIKDMSGCEVVAEGGEKIEGRWEAVGGAVPVQDGMSKLWKFAPTAGGRLPVLAGAVLRLRGAAEGGRFTSAAGCELAGVFDDGPVEVGCDGLRAVKAVAVAGGVAAEGGDLEERETLQEYLTLCEELLVCQHVCACACMHACVPVPSSWSTQPRALCPEPNPTP